MLARKGRTIRVELFDYFKNKNEVAISKQDYSKQRQYIKEELFINSNKDIVNQFYKTNDYRNYKGYLLCAGDGSKLILPRCKELEEQYGTANANNSQQPCVQCLLSGFYDCLNHMMMDIKIAPYASDERELMRENIKSIKQNFADKKIILTLDRGYPSISMLYFLDKIGMKYVIRLQNSTYEKEKREMKSDDEIVEIKLTKDRLTGKMDEETYKELKKKGVYKTRFVKVYLTTGNTEWIATNLDKKEVSTEEIGELYFERWKIEECYDILKNKLQIENISGKNDLTIRQDIHSTIIVYNMLEKIKFIMESDMTNDEKNKYEYKINFNVMIGIIKDILIEFIITESKIKKKDSLIFVMKVF